MTQPAPTPISGTPSRSCLAALRRLLRVTAPDAVTQIALDARAWLAALTAMVRRYIHILAAEISLPPCRIDPPTDDQVPARTSPGPRRYLFPLIEAPAHAGSARAGEDPPELQWALLMEAVQRLVSVLANPAPHALRLARRLRHFIGETLRELAVRWSVIRRIGPGADTLLLRLDQLARPKAWEGIDTS